LNKCIEHLAAASDGLGRVGSPPYPAAARHQSGSDSAPDHQPVPYSKVASMNLHLSLGPLAALIAGILILLVPRLLNYIVALYLIVIGLIGIFGTGSTLH